jgi:hypothetical protein
MGPRTVVAGLVLVLAAACSSPTKQTNEAAEQPLPRWNNRPRPEPSLRPLPSNVLPRQLRSEAH